MFLGKLHRLRESVGTPVVVFTAAVFTIAVCVATALIMTGAALGDTWAVAGLAVVSLFSERGRVKLGQSTEASISLLPALFAAVLFGPLAAMIVFAASMLNDRHAPPMARLLYTSTRALTGAATGAAAGAASGLAHGAVGGLVAAAGVGSLVSEGADAAFASLVFRLRGHGPMRLALREYLPAIAASAPFYMPVVALLAVAYRYLSPVTLPMFLVPALAAQRLFVLYQEERRLAGDLKVANEQLESANLSFATALVATLDARDRYTAGHSAAVAVYARDIAAHLGLSRREQQIVHLAGLVHDVGKIGLPAGLLEKPGALTLEEHRQMEKHPVIGERILANVKTYAEIAAVVRHHHERVDGQGYPDGLAGSQIPLLARIVAVADAYDAMTSDRPYRDAMPSRIARLRLAQAVESQFDTAVVAAFEAVLAGASERYRAGGDRAVDHGGGADLQEAASVIDPRASLVAI